MTTTPDAIEGAAPASVLEAAVKGSSFYNAMRLMPPHRRQGMFAIYAFCREVDDIADGDDPPAVKRQNLAKWRTQIDGIFDRTADHPIARALIAPTEAFNLQHKDFMAVIDGMTMDADADIIAPSMDELDLYCDRVASAVGRLSVRVFGARGDAADKVAYFLGRALQLANILRDIAEDAARGRLYLPAELLDRHGINTREIAQILVHPNLALVGRDLAQVAYGHFAEAERAMKECPRAAMRPARLMGAAYRAILDRIAARGFGDIHTPVKVGRWTKIRILVQYGLI